MAHMGFQLSGMIAGTEPKCPLTSPTLNLKGVCGTMGLDTAPYDTTDM